MVEATLSVVIVGVLLVVSTGTFGSIARARRQQVESRLAYMLAQQLTTEVMQGYFQQPGSNPVFGPVAGQTRASFNYVDAYNGYSACPPVNQTGTTLTGYSGWIESVAVSFVNPTAPTVANSGSTLKLITVTVTAPSGKTYLMFGLRSQFGAYEAVPPSQTNYITGVAISLQGAAPATAVNTTAHPLNITSSQ